MKLLVNGKLQPDSSGLPFSNSLIRGDGLFETILTIDDKPIAWNRHYARLEKSAKSLLITLPARIDIELGISQILLGSKGQSRMRLNVLAEGRNQTLAQMAIAWLLKDSRITTILVGASKPSQLSDSLKSLENQKFEKSELAAIEVILNS